MSYCVHCGVELALSEPACPLCATPVMDPAAPWQRPKDMPYPAVLEKPIEHIDRTYGRRLSLLLLLVPCLMVLLLDLVDGGTFAWSLYVAGALLCIYCWVFIPIFYKFKKPYWYVAIDVAAIAALTMMVSGVSRDWLWNLRLALPIQLLSALFVVLLLLTLRRLEMPLLNRLAVCGVVCALYLVALEALIDQYVRGAIHINWAIYASIPLAVLALMLSYVERNTRLKQEIRKRLFI